MLTDVAVHIKKQSLNFQTNLLGKPNYGYLTVALVIAQVLALKFGGKELDMDALLAEPLIFQLQP